MWLIWDLGTDCSGQGWLLSLDGEELGHSREDGPQG